MPEETWFSGTRRIDGDEERSSCAECGEGVLAFWHRADPSEYDSKDIAFFESIDFVDNLKFGALYRCRANGCLWFLDDNHDQISFVEPAKSELLADWTARDLRPTTDQVALLRKIGWCTGEPEDPISVPCRCVLESGETIDHAIVRFSRTPPTYQEERIVFLDEVIEVSPSDFALSREIRQASYDAPEYWMMYYPTPIETPDGKEFVLSDTCFFFDYDGYRGKDMVLGGSYDASRGHPMEWEEADKPTIVSRDGNVFVYGKPEEGPGALPIVLVWADWRDPFQEPYPPKYFDGPGILDRPIRRRKKWRFW